MRLNVAGDAREEVLARVLPDGFTPLSLTGDLPARLERDGTLRVQVRAGGHEVTLLARGAGAAADAGASGHGRRAVAARRNLEFRRERPAARRGRGRRGGHRSRAGQRARRVAPVARRSAWTPGAKLNVVERSRGLANADDNRLTLQSQPVARLRSRRLHCRRQHQRHDAARLAPRHAGAVHARRARRRTASSCWSPKAAKAAPDSSCASRSVNLDDRGAHGRRRRRDAGHWLGQPLRSGYRACCICRPVTGSSPRSARTRRPVPGGNAGGCGMCSACCSSWCSCTGRPGWIPAAIAALALLLTYQEVPRVHLALGQPAGGARRRARRAGWALPANRARLSHRRASSCSGSPAALPVDAGALRAVSATRAVWIRDARDVPARSARHGDHGHAKTRLTTPMTLRRTHPPCRRTQPR